MKILFISIVVIVVVSGCESLAIDEVLPPQLANIIKATNTDQHLGIKIGGEEFDLLKADKQAYKIIQEFFDVIIEQKEQDICMSRLCKYLHPYFINNSTKCIHHQWRASIRSLCYKAKQHYKSGSEVAIDSIYQTRNTDISEQGTFYSYYLDVDKNRRIQIFFPKNPSEPLKISDFLFIK